MTTSAIAWLGILAGLLCVLLTVLASLIHKVLKRLTLVHDALGSAEKELHVLRQEVRLLRSHVPKNTGLASGAKVSPNDQTLVISRR